MTLIRLSIKGIIAMLLMPAALRAGMPSPLPLDYRYVWDLTGSTRVRLEIISFFLLALVLSATILRWVWNSLHVQFPRLPKVTFVRSLGLIFLWGLLVIVVLTMISGARELMTPGAWEKQGVTYKVSPPKLAPPDVSHHSIKERTAALEQLKAKLWAYSETHGSFPATADEIVPRELWQIPGASELRFIYVPELKGGKKVPFLVYEPNIQPGQRLVLTPDGAIREMKVHEFEDWRYPQDY